MLQYMHMQNIRNKKWFRLGLIILLLLIVIILYFRNVNVRNLGTAEGIRSELAANAKPDTWEKKILIGAGAVLGGALGMEVTNNDYDVQKLIETKGDFKASRVLRDKSGNVVPEGTAGAKYTDEYNCEDFKTHPEAQGFFEKAGGVSHDTNRLDGNKDGVACQHLPKK
jgi:hypothetical protein